MSTCRCHVFCKGNQLLTHLLYQLQDTQEQLQRSQDLVAGLQEQLAAERHMSAAATAGLQHQLSGAQAQVAAIDDDAAVVIAQLRTRVADLELALHQQRFAAAEARADLRRAQAVVDAVAPSPGGYSASDSGGQSEVTDSSGGVQGATGALHSEVAQLRRLVAAGGAGVEELERLRKQARCLELLL